jgi:hypothetical protein
MGNRRLPRPFLTGAFGLVSGSSVVMCRAANGFANGGGGPVGDEAVYEFGTEAFDVGVLGGP